MLTKELNLFHAESVPSFVYIDRGGTPLNKLYRYVPHLQVRFLHRFGLKTGIHCAHFGLELGTMGMYEKLIVSISSE